jgi:hypothetical protein
MAGAVRGLRQRGSALTDDAVDAERRRLADARAKVAEDLIRDTARFRLERSGAPVSDAALQEEVAELRWLLVKYGS